MTMVASKVRRVSHSSTEQDSVFFVLLSDETNVSLAASTRTQIASPFTTFSSSEAPVVTVQTPILPW